ncbi:hypothetical protein KIPE111705_45070 [Kibdelosporangium persicum]
MNWTKSSGANALAANAVVTSDVSRDIRSPARKTEVAVMPPSAASASGTMWAWVSNRLVAVSSTSLK